MSNLRFAICAIAVAAMCGCESSSETSAQSVLDEGSLSGRDAALAAGVEESFERQSPRERSRQKPETFGERPWPFSSSAMPIGWADQAERRLNESLEAGAVECTGGGGASYVPPGCV